MDAPAVATKTPAPSPPALPQGPHVVIHVERDFPFPPDAAYAWLTDYQDDDHTKAGAIIERRNVVKRDADTVELDAHLVTLGQRTHGRAIVRLYPDEHRWVADIARGRWIYEYRLVPTASGSRLLVDYRLGSRKAWRRAMWTLTRPLIKREIHRMWDGFERAMKEELRASRA